MIRVTITEEHILNGECNNPKLCAVARALIDATNTFNMVYVTGAFVEIGEVEYTLPAEVREFIDLFDEGFTPTRQRGSKFWPDQHIASFSFIIRDEDRVVPEEEDEREDYGYKD